MRPFTDCVGEDGGAGLLVTFVLDVVGLTSWICSISGLLP